MSDGDQSEPRPLTVAERIAAMKRNAEQSRQPSYSTTNDVKGIQKQRQFSVFELKNAKPSDSNGSATTNSSTILSPVASPFNKSSAFTSSATSSNTSNPIKINTSATNTSAASILSPSPIVSTPALRIDRRVSLSPPPGPPESPAPPAPEDYEIPEAPELPPSPPPPPPAEEDISPDLKPTRGPVDPPNPSILAPVVSRFSTASSSQKPTSFSSSASVSPFSDLPASSKPAASIESGTNPLDVLVSLGVTLLPTAPDSSTSSSSKKLKIRPLSLKSPLRIRSGENASLSTTDSSSSSHRSRSTRKTTRQTASSTSSSSAFTSGLEPYFEGFGNPFLAPLVPKISAEDEDCENIVGSVNQLFSSSPPPDWQVLDSALTALQSSSLAPRIVRLCNRFLPFVAGFYEFNLRFSSSTKDVAYPFSSPYDVDVDITAFTSDLGEDKKKTNEETDKLKATAREELCRELSERPNLFFFDPEADWAKGSAYLLPDGSIKPSSFETIGSDSKDASNHATFPSIPPVWRISSVCFRFLRILRELMMHTSATVRSSSILLFSTLLMSVEVARASLVLSVDYLLSRTLISDDARCASSPKSATLTFCQALSTYSPVLFPRSLLLGLSLLLSSPADKESRETRSTAMQVLITLAPLIPRRLAQAGGVLALVSGALDVSLSALHPPATMALLSVLDHPNSRRYVSATDFAPIYATYSDITSPASEQKERQHAAAHTLLITVLRSFTGLFVLSTDPNGLPALIQLLSLPVSISGSAWARECVFDLVFDALSIIRSVDLTEYWRNVKAESGEYFHKVSSTGEIFSLFDLRQDVIHAQPGAGGGLSSTTLSPPIGTATGGNGGSVNLRENGSTNGLGSKGSYRSPLPILPNNKANSNPSDTFNDPFFRSMAPAHVLSQVNLVHSYSVMLLLVLINCGLMEHLVLVSLSTHQEYSSVATDILIELLRIASVLLPRSVCSELASLNSVFHFASSVDQAPSKSIHQVLNFAKQSSLMHKRPFVGVTVRTTNNNMAVSNFGQPNTRILGNPESSETGANSLSILASLNIDKSVFDQCKCCSSCVLCAAFFKKPTTTSPTSISSILSPTSSRTSSGSVTRPNNTTDSFPVFSGVHTMGDDDLFYRSFGTVSPFYSNSATAGTGSAMTLTDPEAVESSSPWVHDVEAVQETTALFSTPAFSDLSSGGMSSGKARQLNAQAQAQAQARVRVQAQAQAQAQVQAQAQAQIQAQSQTQTQLPTAPVSGATALMAFNIGSAAIWESFDTATQKYLFGSRPGPGARVAWPLPVQQPQTQYQQLYDQYYQQQQQQQLKEQQLKEQQLKEQQQQQSLSRSNSSDANSRFRYVSSSAKAAAASESGSGSTSGSISGPNGSSTTIANSTKQNASTSAKSTNENPYHTCGHICIACYANQKSSYSTTGTVGGIVGSATVASGLSSGAVPFPLQLNLSPDFFGSSTLETLIPPSFNNDSNTLVGRQNNARVRSVQLLSKLFYDSVMFFDLATRDSLLHLSTKMQMPPQSGTGGASSSSANQGQGGSSRSPGAISGLGSSGGIDHRDAFWYLDIRFNNPRAYNSNLPASVAADNAIGRNRTSYFCHGMNLGRLIHFADNDARSNNQFKAWTPGVRPLTHSASLLSLKLHFQSMTSEATLNKFLRLSNVLSSKIPSHWDWGSIYHLLEFVLPNPVHAALALRTKFFKRLLSFTRLDKKMFSELSWVTPNLHISSVVNRLFQIMLSFPEGRAYPFFLQAIELMVEHLYDELHRVYTGPPPHIFQNKNMSAASSSSSTSLSSSSTSTLSSSSSSTLPGSGLSYTPYLSTATASATFGFSHSAKTHGSTRTAALHGITNTIGNGGSSKPVRPFSLTSMTTKLSRDYVTLFGVLTSTSHGVTILNKFSFYSTLKPLAEYTNKDYLTRAFVSALDYDYDIQARDLLHHWALVGSEGVRRAIIATLQRCFRAKASQFSSWGISLLLTLLYSPDLQTSLFALAALEECATHDHICRCEIIRRRVDASRFGAFAYGLNMCLLSVPEGLTMLLDHKWLIPQLAVWAKYGNHIYMEFVEKALSHALSTRTSVDAIDADVEEGDGGSSPASGLTSFTSPSPLYPTLAPFSAHLLPAPPVQVPDVLHKLLPKYSLYTSHAWLAADSVVSEHDLYLQSLIPKLPWVVELSVEVNTSSSLHLLTDAYVTKGFGDAGVPYLHTLSPAAFKNAPTHHPNCPLSFATGTPPPGLSGKKCTCGAGQYASPATASSWLPNLPHIEEGHFEGSAATYVVGLVLDIDGYPCPFPIEKTSILRSRLSIGATTLSASLSPFDKSFPKNASFSTEGGISSSGSNSIPANHARSDNSFTTTSSVNASSSSGSSSSAASDMYRYNRYANEPVDPFSEFWSCHFQPTAVTSSSTSASATGASSSGSAGDNAHSSASSGGVGGSGSVSMNGLNTISPGVTSGNAPGAGGDGLSSSHSISGGSSGSGVGTGMGGTSLNIGSFADAGDEMEGCGAHGFNVGIPTRLYAAAHREFFKGVTECVKVCTPADRALLIPSHHSCDSMTHAIIAHNEANARMEQTVMRAASMAPSPAALSSIGLAPSTANAIPTIMEDGVPINASSGILPDYGAYSLVLEQDNIRWCFVPRAKQALKATLGVTPRVITDVANLPDGLSLAAVWFRLPPTASTVLAVTTRPHLYGEIAKTNLGLSLLTNDVVVNTFVDPATNEVEVETLNPMGVLVEQLGAGDIPLSSSPEQSSSTSLVSSSSTMATQSTGAKPSTSNVARTRSMVSQLAPNRKFSEEDIAQFFSVRRSPSRKRAALWALATIGSTEGGGNLLLKTPVPIFPFRPLKDQPNVVQYISDTAFNSPILSLKGTAFYILTMLLRSSYCRSILSSLGWVCDMPEGQLFMGGKLSPLDPYGYLRLPSLEYDGGWVLSTDNHCGVDQLPRSTNSSEAAKAQAAAAAVVAGLDPDVLEEPDEVRQREQTLFRASETGILTKDASDIILGLLSNLCNTVTQKNAITALKTYKMKYAPIFDHPALYARVMKFIEGHSFSLSAIRYITYDLFRFSMDSKQLQVFDNVIARE